MVQVKPLGTLGSFLLLGSCSDNVEISCLKIELSDCTGDMFLSHACHVHHRHTHVSCGTCYSKWSDFQLMLFLTPLWPIWGCSMLADIIVYLCLLEVDNFWLYMAPKTLARRPHLAKTSGWWGLRWQWHQLDLCKQPAPCSRQITTPTPQRSVFTGRMLFVTPNQQCQSTEAFIIITWLIMGGSVAGWLACWTQAQKGPGSNRSRDKLFTAIVPLFTRQQNW